MNAAAITNAIPQAPGFSMSALTKALERLKSLPPEEEQVHHFRAGKDYLAERKRRVPVAESRQTFAGGMLGSCAGMKIVLDDDLPPDVCEFCNKHGKLL